ncbi:unnamed protein product [Brassica oleracea var. botrytis]|uniref:Uncharacterized protein n=1 Tax=Brassica oleracea TaxID=3712 RepID=A0A3P6EZC0_BRAOL|nr:unnamed protein product [Brassica oleracea]
MVMVEQPSTTVPPADNSESLETEDLPKNYLKFRRADTGSGSHRGQRRKPTVNKWELVTCPACQAIFWIGEAVVQETRNTPRMFSICCQQGRVKLPPRRQPPSPPRSPKFHAPD